MNIDKRITTTQFFEITFRKKDVRLILLLLVSFKLAKPYFTKPPDTVRSLSLEHAQFMVQIYVILLRLAATSFLVAMGPHLICLVHLTISYLVALSFDSNPWLASSLSNAGGLDQTHPDCG